MKAIKEIKETVIENEIELEKITSYYDNGQLRREEYWKDGKLHRENKPAITEYLKNGQLWYDAYFLNGEKQI